jgi:hypothetical protein
VLFLQRKLPVYARKSIFYRSLLLNIPCFVKKSPPGEGFGEKFPCIGICIGEIQSFLDGSIKAGELTSCGKDPVPLKHPIR